jgi:hypothetical protein
MRTIVLTKGKVAIVDAEDYATLRGFKWYALFRDGSWHAARTVKRNGEKRTVYMHRQIMGEPEGMLVDHRNRDGLDNRRENLRVCTKRQNAWNGHRRIRNKTSRFKGVCRQCGRVGATGRPWRATITVAGRQKYLGWFKTQADAARAYDDAAVFHFGEFARTNFQRR